MHPRQTTETSRPVAPSFWYFMARCFLSVGPRAARGRRRDGRAQRMLAAVPVQTSQWRTEFRVGDRRVRGVADGIFTMTEGFMNVPGIQRQFENDEGRADLPVGSFVVDGEQTVLVDAGVGPFGVEGLVGGNLLDELAAIGVRPGDVDVIALTHLHLDHDGWVATRDAGVTFPNATIHLGRGDYERFVVNDPPDRFTMARHKKTAFAELFDAGRVELVDDTTEIVPGVVLLPTPGHTPGHLAVAV